MPGEVLLEFDPVTFAVLYAAEWSTDEGQTWQNGVYPSARRAVIGNLPQRQEIQFRVRALGTQQRKGAPSAMVSVFVV